MASLKQTLDAFYMQYNFRERLLYDPIEFPHRYKTREDIAVSGFVASCFAYGKVALFKPVVAKLLSLMGSHPHSFLMDFTVRKHGKYFKFKYRFNESEDILCLAYLLHVVLKKYSSLENAFSSHYSPGDSDTGRAIAGFVDEAMSVDTSPVYGEDIHPRGITQLFPSPVKGSACKRMNLFLRWMVRDRDIDFGIWKDIPANKLVIPLDVHIARISRCLGLTRRSSADWRTAVEITEALKELDPADPLKYDFALCHHGISGLCKSRGGPACKECVLK
ncbi:MAG TPA: TIGR02757 family protein [Thermodesulfovibrionales bacterium]|nr:TIGR02757 family protein [Thermodesulfovibrionales bacterium]